jgi:hypothetical protein
VRLQAVVAQLQAAFAARAVSAHSQARASETAAQDLAALLALERRVAALDQLHPRWV